MIETARTAYLYERVIDLLVEKENFEMTVRGVWIMPENHTHAYSLLMEYFPTGMWLQYTQNEPSSL